MTRLADEFQRLYGPPPAGADAGQPGPVRALVLELMGPADWSALSAVWRGVQADLAWPAPAIAVNGRDALQLWFSLAEPVSAVVGRAGLDALCARYLPGVPPRRVRLRCGVASSAQAEAAGQAEPVPAAQATPDQWSAFVAQDLAPIFEETPWLDIPPSEEGQAQLLAGLTSLTPVQWARIQAAVTAPSSALSPAPDGHASAAGVAAVGVDVAVRPAAEAAGEAAAEACAFLRRVMNDAAQPMAVRIEAAKALLSTTLPGRSTPAG